MYANHSQSNPLREGHDGGPKEYVHNYVFLIILTRLIIYLAFFQNDRSCNSEMKFTMWIR